MKARQPDRQDLVDRNGVKIGFEVYDGGTPALLLVNSRSTGSPSIRSRRCSRPRESAFIRQAGR
jgi:hypothetical protein